MPLTLKENCFDFTENKRNEQGFLDDQAVIEARTELLDRVDRNLLRAALIYNQPTKIIAQMNRITPSTVRYRIRKLIARIGSAQFVGAARSQGLFNAEQAAVARHHVLQGKSLRATVAATGLPYHTIRRVLAEVDGIIDGMSKAQEKYPSLPHQEHGV